MEIEHGTPKEFSLEQNYPNPFNPSTQITFHTPESGFIRLKVFDVLGKVVAILMNEQKDAGTYTVEFNADNLVSGMYYYELFNGKNSITRKMILIK